MADRGVIIDLDGTVYVGYDLIDGVSDAIQTLRDSGFDLLFFSNNPIMDGEDYVEFLTGLGLDVRPGEAISSGDVTVSHLLEHHADDEIFCIGADGLCDQLESAGLSVTENPDDGEVLVASWTADFEYRHLREALVVADTGAPFYGTDPDRTFQMAEDETVPGSGAIIGSVAATIDREPDQILGKPSPASLDYATTHLGVDPGDCLVVGDRLDTDLRMGEQGGMETVLVMTGVTDRERMDRQLANGFAEPDHVIDSIASIEEALTDED